MLLNFSFLFFFSLFHLFYPNGSWINYFHLPPPPPPPPLPTAEALAAQTTQENFDKGLIYPPFSNIRKISAHIAAKVAAKAYELGESFFLISSACTKGSLPLSNIDI
jgi:hypothetical protein